MRRGVARGCARLCSGLGAADHPPALACPHQVRRQVRPHLLEVYEPGYHVERLVELFRRPHKRPPHDLVLLYVAHDMLHHYPPAAQRLVALLLPGGQLAVSGLFCGRGDVGPGAVLGNPLVPAVAKEF